MSLRNCFESIIACFAFLALLTLPACSKSGGGKPADVNYYTCTMHPSVRSQKPDDKCPICAMDLVPVMKKGSGGEETHQHELGGGMSVMPGDSSKTGMSEFSVPVERQQQIGVRYAETKFESLHHTIRSVGFIVPDRSKHWEFVARVEGYVQKLHVTSPGERVEENQPLLTIYSPELLTTSREFVNMLETRDRASTPEMRANMQKLIDGAKLRLGQWNVTDQQIEELEKSRKPSEFLTLYSPFKGIVEDVPVDQGRKIMIGDHLVDVADLSLVWVWAEFYENELPMLEKGQDVTISSSSYPGQKFEGKIALINPFVNATMRTGKVRIDIPNPELKLQPGMYVDIELGMEMGKGLTIPVSAIMPTGTRNIVFIDKGEGKLEPRIVERGHKFGDSYEILAGLKVGDRVVSSANFLIDAESKVQGAVKSFEEPPMAMLPTTHAAAAAAESAKVTPLPLNMRPLWEPLVGSYLEIQQLLAKDEFESIAAKAGVLHKQIAALSEATPKLGELDDSYRTGVQRLNASAGNFRPTSLEEARVQFGHVSFDLIALLTQFPPPVDFALNVMKCSMWKKSPGCWIQTGAELENPFMGQRMPGCGEKVGSLQVVK